MADDAILTVPIDVATALDILRAGTATVVLEADENGVQIRLPFTLALSFAPVDEPREEATPPPIEPKHRKPKAAKFVCAECPDESFASPQALGAHRRYQHPGQGGVRVKPEPVRDLKFVGADEPLEIDVPVARKPSFVDAGPMTRRKFDPDQARAGAANGI